MAGKVYEIGFKIAGDLSGNFSKSFKNANKAIETFSNNLESLNKQASDVSEMIKLRKNIAETARTYAQARVKIGELGKQISETKNKAKELTNSYNRQKAALGRLEKQISETENPAKELIDKFNEEKAALAKVKKELSLTNQKNRELVTEFNKQKATMKKSREAIDKNRISLKELETATGMAADDIKKLTAREEELARAADRARKAQERQQKAISGIKSGVEGAQANAGYAGASAAAMGGGLVAAVKQAMSYEDQTAELRKFSDEADTIFEDIIGLTRKYAKTSEDMTNMAAAAMQSGIAKTGKDVITIVEQQTQAAVAFGMTGDQVGSAWADIQSKMGMSVDQTKDVFDIVNQISNTTSASAEGIIEVLQRQGGTLKGLTALTSEQITALAGAFRSAAPSAEVAATSMGTFIGRLTTGGAATKAQKDALSKLGMNSVTLAKQLTGTSKTAQSAIQNVFAQINKLPAHEQGAVIGQLFGTEAGIKSAVSTLAKQSNLLGGNLATVADKSNYAGSMFGEYSSRANTTSNALGIVKNNVMELAGKIGTNFIPQIKAAAKWVQDNSTKIIAWVEQNKGLITTLGYVAAGLAGLFAAAVPLFVAFKTLAFYANILKIGYHALSLAFQKNTYTMAANKIALVAHTVASKAWTVATKGMAAAQRVLNLVLKMNPIGLVITLITALILLAGHFYDKWDYYAAGFAMTWSWIKEGVINAFNAIKSALSGVGSALASVFSSIGSVFKGFLNGIISFLNSSIRGINKALGGVKIPDWVPAVGGKSIGINIPQIPQLAEGGIATRSTLANIGEGREPEAVLPLSKLSAMLGTSGGAGGSNISVSFSPTINVSGGDSADVYGQVKRGLDAGRVELERAIEQILAKKRRLSYV